MRITGKLFFCSVLICLTACGRQAAPDTAVLPDLPVYGNTWRMAEQLDDSAYDEYMHGDGHTFQKLLAFSQKLQSSADPVFTAYTANHVELLNTAVPDQCKVNNGTEFADESVYEIDGEPAVAAEALQVTENFFDLFPLRISEGRGFTDEDYDYMNSGRIPVILGSAYKESFSIGDTFEGYYIFQRFVFEVIGFAESGNPFYSSAESRPVPADRYIIMPFAEIIEDSAIARAVLLQKTCGLITDSRGRDHALEQVGKWLAEAGLEDWTEQFYITDSSLQTMIRQYLK